MLSIFICLMLVSAQCFCSHLQGSHLFNSSWDPLKRGCDHSDGNICCTTTMGASQLKREGSLLKSCLIVFSGMICLVHAKYLQSMLYSTSEAPLRSIYGLQFHYQFFRWRPSVRIYSDIFYLDWIEYMFKKIFASEFYYLYLNLHWHQSHISNVKSIFFATIHMPNKTCCYTFALKIYEFLIKYSSKPDI